MSQHDFDIANQGFAAFRTDVNNALQALGSLSSGTTAPATTYANQLWYETDTNTLWLRNEANSAWLNVIVIDQATGSPSFTAGNVGIGTVSPTAKLDIVHTGLQFRIANSASSGYGFAQFGQSATATQNWHIGSEGDGTFRWYNGDSGAGAVRMTITSSGNVGIGTSSPTAALSVNGSITMPAATTEDRLIEIGGGRTGNGNSYIDFVTDATYTDFGLRIIRGNTGANSASLITHRGVGNFSIQTQDAAALLLQTNSVSRLTIGSTGTVTISDLAGTGTRTVTATATGGLAAASDSRLKQEVPEASIAGLAEIMQLRPVAYKWLDDIENRGDEAAVELGFFADETKDIIPSAAPMGNDGYYGFYDRAVIAALTKAVQEQQAIITAIEARLTAANL